MKLNLALLAPLAVFSALGGAFFVYLTRENPEELPSTFVGRPAPELTMEPLADFPQATSADLQASGLKLVNFWASWCPPCRAEHPNLVALKEEGWTIIGVNKSDNEPNALGFIRELGDPYSKHASDPNGRGSLDWGVYGLPETFLVDGEGNIILRHPGPITQRVWSDRFGPVIRQFSGS